MKEVRQLAPDIFDEAGVVVVPLFMGEKHPVWPGYRGDRPLLAARDWMLKQRDAGYAVSLTGRYALLDGWGCVIDCEGKKWTGEKGWERAWDLPKWLQVVQEVAAGGLLPSWVSAGGDGGRDVRNVLIPFRYEDVCRGIGVEAGGQGSKYHRVALGSEGRAEMLLKAGVCIPISRVGDATVHWAGPHFGEEGSGDGLRAGPSLSEVVARAVNSEIMPDLMRVLGAAVKDAKEAGVSVNGGAGDDAGDEPLVKSVAVALAHGGAKAGLVATREALEGGASRHYCVKTWCNWVFAMFGNSDWLNAPDGLDVLGERILNDWAGEAGFTKADVMKSVRDEAKFMAKWIRQPLPDKPW